MADTNNLIWSPEACEILGVSKPTLSRLVANGDLSPVEMGPAPSNAARLFDRAEVEALAARRRSVAS